MQRSSKRYIESILAISYRIDIGKKNIEISIYRYRFNILSMSAKRRRCCLFIFFFVGNKSISSCGYLLFKVTCHHALIIIIPHTNIIYSSMDATILVSPVDPTGGLPLHRLSWVGISPSLTALYDVSQIPPCLPPTRHRWTRLSLVQTRQAGTRFAYHGGMGGWVDLGALGYCTEMVYVRRQLWRTWRRATLLIETKALT